MKDSESLKSHWIYGVEVGFWNPDRATNSNRAYPVDNMGDLLGPLIVQLMLASRGITPNNPVPDNSNPATTKRLLTVGSIAHFAERNDVLWGTGINGKALARSPHGLELDIRAVRGPWTAAELTHHGYDVPTTYGDPALLLRDLMPAIPRYRELCGRRLIVPNFNSTPDYLQRVQEFERQGLTVLSPQTPLFIALSAIAHAEFVIGSSLHAIAIADAYGVPARIVASDTEPAFKYVDYLLGSGRYQTVMAKGVMEALDLGGHESAQTDNAALLEAFPWDLWDD